MIARKDFFFIERSEPESFIEGFLSEVCPLNEEETKRWGYMKNAKIF